MLKLLRFYIVHHALFYPMNDTSEMVFTKEMVLNAFQQNKRKRNFILYKVYESWFSYDLTAETIASRISQDLGYTISKSIVDMTRIRVMKKQGNTSENSPIPTSSTPAQIPIKNTEMVDIFVPPAQTDLTGSGEKNQAWEFIKNEAKQDSEKMKNPKDKTKDIFTFQ
jgi:hypothetical protein